MTGRRTARPRRALALLTFAVAAGACAGPMEPLDIATKPIATDIALGRRVRAVAEAPLPPSVFTLLPRRTGEPFALAEQLPVRQVVRRPRAPACPSATQPGPRFGTNNSVLAPPEPATYRYDVTGAELTGTSLQARQFPATSTHEVGNVQRLPIGTFTFDVSAELGGQRTVSTYRVIPLEVGVTPPDLLEQVDNADRMVMSGGRQVVDLPSTKQALGGAPRQAAPVEPGLYLAAVQRPGSAVPVRFREGGVKLLGFPIGVGATFRSTATDGVVVFDYTSTVVERAVVNACSALLAAWQVDIAGTMAIPAEQTALPFTATYFIAPQFGGLVVEARTRVGPFGGGSPGVDRGQPVLVRLLNERITQEPAPVVGAT